MIPYDVKQECLWIVRGYSRRAKERVHLPQDVQRIHAVEYALNQIGHDIQDCDTRQRLRNAIVLNCESGKQYPFERLAVDGFSRSEFYRRKDKFLYSVAKYMGIA